MITIEKPPFGISAILQTLLCLLFAGTAVAGTARSTYLGNDGRTGYVDARVPTSPALLWVYHEKHPPRHAWPEPNREIQYIDFDYATQTAICDGKVAWSLTDRNIVAARGDSLGSEQPLPTKGLPHVKVIQQSPTIFAFDKQSGKLLWEHALERSVSATAIVADDRAVYLLDRTGGARYALFRRPGAKGNPVSVLKAP